MLVTAQRNFPWVGFSFQLLSQSFFGGDCLFTSPLFALSTCRCHRLNGSSFLKEVFDIDQSFLQNKQTWPDAKFRRKWILFFSKNTSHVTHFLRWPPDQVRKGCRQSADSLAMGQVNREWLVSHSIPNHSRAVAKKDNSLEDNTCLHLRYQSSTGLP